MVKKLARETQLYQILWHPVPPDFCTECHPPSRIHSKFTPACRMQTEWQRVSWFLAAHQRN